MIPVRSSGCISFSSRAQPLASSAFARQLLYSAGFEDIQAVQLTTLQGFTQSLPGEQSLGAPVLVFESHARPVSLPRVSVPALELDCSTQYVVDKQVLV